MQKFIFVTTLMENYLDKYIKANKEEKSEILNELEFSTKLHRKSLIRFFKRKQFSFRPRSRGGSKSKYHHQTIEVLDLIWEASDYICAERLSPELENTISDLLKDGYLKRFCNTAIEQVRKMPLGTLKVKLRKLPRPTGLTVKHKSGKSDLRKTIPISTKQGNAIRCGHLEMDFVDHTGGDASGHFARSFSLADVFSEWHVKHAVLGKTFSETQEAYRQAELKMPFNLISLHSDNEPGLLLTMSGKKSKKMRLGISRSRPYQKQDNGHVEQKNGDKIRGLVGYRRYDSIEQVNLLNMIYALDDLVQNYFIPSMKLVEKEYNENGKLLRKIYDKAKTPYTRVLEDSTVSSNKKQILIDRKPRLNRLELIRERNKLLRKLKSLG